ncbi:TPA: hypothetical protein QCQ24_002324 [Bacillus cereus]|nr:hypothetical protein [Bacillus cereus]
MANKDNDKKENTERWAKIFTWIGFALVPIAVAMPFIVYYFDFSYLKELGAVGDFIGGTTVTFLTGASVFLLIATNIMQRKELQISRESIDQLVEQTAASIQQAEEAKVETQITNETMKKQQFETTFFNMVSLHQNKVDRMNFEGEVGIQIIESCLKYMKQEYSNAVSDRFKKRYIDDDYNEIVGLFKFLRTKGITKYRHFKLEDKEEVLKAYDKLEFESILKYKKENVMIREYSKELMESEDEYKIGMAYYNMKMHYSSILKSYINSLSVIIQFLCDSEYEKEDIRNNTQKYKIYREILFSQFAPSEMLLLYYHVQYALVSPWQTDSSESESTESIWLKEELKVYDLFYTDLPMDRFLFRATDVKNMVELLK